MFQGRTSLLQFHLNSWIKILILWPSLSWMVKKKFLHNTIVLKTRMRESFSFWITWPHQKSARFQFDFTHRPTNHGPTSSELKLSYLIKREGSGKTVNTSAAPF